MEAFSKTNRTKKQKKTNQTNKFKKRPKTRAFQTEGRKTKQGHTRSYHAPLRRMQMQIKRLEHLHRLYFRTNQSKRVKHSAASEQSCSLFYSMCFVGVLLWCYCVISLQPFLLFTVVTIRNWRRSSSLTLSVPCVLLSKSSCCSVSSSPSLFVWSGSAWCRLRRDGLTMRPAGWLRVRGWLQQQQRPTDPHCRRDERDTRHATPLHSNTIMHDHSNRKQHTQRSGPVRVRVCLHACTRLRRVSDDDSAVASDRSGCVGTRGRGALSRTMWTRIQLRMRMQLQLLPPDDWLHRAIRMQ